MGWTKVETEEAWELLEAVLAVHKFPTKSGESRKMPMDEFQIEERTSEVGYHFKHIPTGRYLWVYKMDVIEYGKRGELIMVAENRIISAYFLQSDEGTIDAFELAGGFSKNVLCSDVIGVRAVVTTNTTKLLSHSVFTLHQSTAGACSGSVSGINSHNVRFFH